MNGQSLHAILDTGASVNAIDPKFQQWLKPLSKTTTTNFSDHTGAKTSMSKGTLRIDGSEQELEFVVTPLKIKSDCCDIILGKPFLDKNKVFLQFSSSKVRFNFTGQTKGQHSFRVEKSAKEITVPCTANGQSTMGRFDLGSEQALDVTGEFSKKLNLKEMQSLETMLQPTSVAKVKVSCGSWNLDPEVPALIQPFSQK